jgi:tetratricopeptide (TPR) repeat protein
LHRAVLTIVVPLFLIACTKPPAPPERASLPDVTVVAETPASVDKLAFIRLLKDRQFEALDAWLTAYQEAFEAGRISDNVVRYAFDAFAYSDPTTEALLDQWVSESDTSYAALMARSMYYAHRAYITRNLYTAMPRDLVAEMESYQGLAIEDASRALGINPGLSIGYFHLNKISWDLYGWQPRKSQTRHWVEQGLEAVPRSILLRRAHLDNLANTKGGSLDEIKAFIEATEDTFPPETDLGVLPGYANYATAVVLAKSERYTDAVRMIDRALAFGDDPKMRLKKADFLHYLKRNNEVLEELDRAVRLEPQSVWYLSHRAHRRRAAGLIADALADYDLILELDPFEPRFLRARATLLSLQERHEEALIDLDKAVIYGGFESFVWFVRGRVKLYGRSTNEAILEFNQGIKRDPRIVRHLFKYATRIAERTEPPSDLRECRRASMLRVYQQLCKDHGHCELSTLARSEEFLGEFETQDISCG